jgi:tellurite resistance protein
VAYTREQLARAQKRFDEGERRRRERLARARAELEGEDPAKLAEKRNRERLETDARLSGGHRQADERRKKGAKR